jgi:hypothetical protein
MRAIEAARQANVSGTVTVQPITRSAIENENHHCERVNTCCLKNPLLFANLSATCQCARAAAAAAVTARRLHDDTIIAARELIRIRMQ